MVVTLAAEGTGAEPDMGAEGQDALAKLGREGLNLLLCALRLAEREDFMAGMGDGAARAMKVHILRYLPDYKTYTGHPPAEQAQLDEEWLPRSIALLDNPAGFDERERQDVAHFCAQMHMRAAALAYDKDDVASAIRHATEADRLQSDRSYCAPPHNWLDDLCNTRLALAKYVRLEHPLLARQHLESLVPEIERRMKVAKPHPKWSTLLPDVMLKIEQVGRGEEWDEWDENGFPVTKKKKPKKKKKKKKKADDGDDKGQDLIGYLRAQRPHEHAEQQLYLTWVDLYVSAIDSLRLLRRCAHSMAAAERAQVLYLAGTILKGLVSCQPPKLAQARQPFTLLWALSDQVKSETCFQLGPENPLDMDADSVREVARTASHLFVMALGQHKQTPEPTAPEAASQYRLDECWMKLCLVRFGVTVRRGLLPSVHNEPDAGEGVPGYDEVSFLRVMDDFSGELYDAGFACDEVAMGKLAFLQRLAVLHMEHAWGDGHQLVAAYEDFAVARMDQAPDDLESFCHVYEALHRRAACLYQHQGKIDAAMRKWKLAAHTLGAIAGMSETEEGRADSLEKQSQLFTTIAQLEGDQTAQRLLDNVGTQ